MKKNILVGSLITLAVLSVSCLTQSVFAKTMKGDIQAIRIPQGSVLNVDLLDGLSTGVAGVCSTVTAGESSTFVFLGFSSGFVSTPP